MSALESGGEAVAPEPAAGPPRGVHTMAIVRWMIVLVTALAATGTIWHFASAPGQPAVAAAVQLYRCPMHAQVIRDRPGQCPICNMTLIPITQAAPAPPAAGGAAPPGLTAVDLSPERVQLIGMKTAVVERRALGGELRTVGQVEASERGLAQVNVRFSGWLQKLFVSATGERVHQGQVLATIYSPDVLRAEQELLVASGWKATAPATGGGHVHDSAVASLDANARRRLELLGISSQELDEILASGKPVEAIAIRSPVDGYVIAKGAQAGVAVQPGTVLFQVADLSTVWVTADVYEQDLRNVQVGQQARFEPSGYPGETHKGKVQFVYPTLDPSSRALKIRIELKNRFDKTGPRLRPGMSGTVRLDGPRSTGLVAPVEAIVDTGDARYLFVSKPGGRFEPRVVKVGAHVGDQVEILSGVTEGETVVTTGNFLIDSESRLRDAIQGQTAQAPKGH